MLSVGVQDHISVLFDQFRDEIQREYIHPLRRRHALHATLVGRFVRGLSVSVIEFLSSSTSVFGLN